MRKIDAPNKNIEKELTSPPKNTRPVGPTRPFTTPKGVQDVPAKKPQMPPTAPRVCAVRPARPNEKTSKLEDEVVPKRIRIMM